MCRLWTPAWVLIKAWVCSVLEPWDPTVGGPDPIRGVWVPFLGSDSHTWGSWTKLGGLDRTYRGLALSHGGLVSLLMPWSISLTLDTWRPRTRLCGGVRRCCWPRVVARGWGESWPGPTYNSFITRLRVVAWALCFYTAVRGTLVSGYRQWPPAHLRGGCEPAGGAKACTLPQHGLIGDWRAVLARLLTRPLSIHLRSRQLPYLSLRLTGPRPHAWWFRWATRGVPRCHFIGFKDYLLSSAAAPRRRAIACGG
jgi:hypothetical protein